MTNLHLVAPIDLPSRHPHEPRLGMLRPVTDCILMRHSVSCETTRPFGSLALPIELLELLVLRRTYHRAEATVTVSAVAYDRYGEWNER